VLVTAGRGRKQSKHPDRRSEKLGGSRIRLTPRVIYRESHMSSPAGTQKLPERDRERREKGLFGYWRRPSAKRPDAVARAMECSERSCRGRVKTVLDRAENEERWFQGGEGGSTARGGGKSLSSHAWSGDEEEMAKSLSTGDRERMLL